MNNPDTAEVEAAFRRLKDQIAEAWPAHDPLPRRLVEATLALAKAIEALQTVLGVDVPSPAETREARLRAVGFEPVAPEKRCSNLTAALDGVGVGAVTADAPDPPPAVPVATLFADAPPLDDSDAAWGLVEVHAADAATWAAAELDCIRAECAADGETVPPPAALQAAERVAAQLIAKAARFPRRLFFSASPTDAGGYNLFLDYRAEKRLHYIIGPEGSLRRAIKHDRNAPSESRANGDICLDWVEWIATSLAEGAQPAGE